MGEKEILIPDADKSICNKKKWIFQEKIKGSRQSI